MQLVSEAEEKLASIAKDKAQYKSLLTDLLVQVRGGDSAPHIPGTSQCRALLIDLLWGLIYGQRDTAWYEILPADLLVEVRWACMPAFIVAALLHSQKVSMDLGLSLCMLASMKQVG